MLYDLLVTNGEIYSMEKPDEKFSAMGIKDGLIRELFSETPTNPDKISKKILDVRGKAVLPGLIDSHTHFIYTAIMSQVAFPVSEMVEGRIMPDSIDGVGEKVKRIAQGIPKDNLLIFNNYITSSIKEGRLPYREEIDSWLPDRTVTFFTIGLHSASFSTKALEESGIDPSNHNGILDESDEDYTPDKLTQMVENHLSLPMIINGIQQTVNDALSYGIVGIHCLEGDGSDPAKEQTITFLKNYGSKLPLKLRLYTQVKDVDQLASMVSYLRTSRMGGCGILCVDGAVSAKTAAFYKPYNDDPDNYGEILYPYEELVSDIRKSHDKGYQYTIHAIGTKAIDHTLNAMEQVLRESGDSTNKHRFRIDHFEFPSKEAVERAVADNIILVCQPGFNWIDHNYPGMQLYEAYLPPEVLALQIPLRTIVEKGGIICGSTDSPVQSLDPFLQIQGMVNFPIEGESLSVYEAFRAYTYNGAYATFEEDIRGTLRAGKQADFIVLDRDPFKIPRDEIKDLKVLETFIDGEKMRFSNSNPWIFLLKTMIRSQKKI